MFGVIMSCCFFAQVEVNVPTSTQIEPERFLAYQLFLAKQAVAIDQSRYTKKHPAMFIKQLKAKQLSITLKKATGKNRKKYNKLLDSYRKIELAKAEAELQVRRQLLYHATHPQLALLRQRVLVLKKMNFKQKPKKSSKKKSKKK